METDLPVAGRLEFQSPGRSQQIQPGNRQRSPNEVEKIGDGSVLSEKGDEPVVTTSIILHLTPAMHPMVQTYFIVFSKKWER